MSVHSLRLPSLLEHELDDLVRTTGRTKTYYIVEAIKSYIEDKADYLKAVTQLEKVESGKIKLKTLDEIMAKYDLAD